MDKDVKKMKKHEGQNKTMWDKAKAQVAKVLDYAPECDWDDKDWRTVESIFKQMRNKQYANKEKRDNDGPR